jgi:hypothetical protein
MNISPAEGKQILNAGIYTIVYTCPSTQGVISATLNARVVVHDLTRSHKIRMAVVGVGFVQGTNAPSNDAWIQPLDIAVGSSGVTSGVIEDTSIILSPGESIVMYSDIGDANGRVHGFVRSN